jgi:hypothetical protein
MGNKKTIQIQDIEFEIVNKFVQDFDNSKDFKPLIILCIHYFPSLYNNRPTWFGFLLIENVMNTKVLIQYSICFIQKPNVNLIASQIKEMES